MVALAISVMTLPTVFQMFGGKPKIRVEFEKTILDELTVLRCHIWNQPVRNRVLRRLRVVREPVEISVSFSVERTSGELVAPLVTPTITTEKESGKQVTLFYHAVPARVAIIIIKQNTAFILYDDEKKLKPGGYVVNLDLILSNATMHRYQEKLVIGENANQSYWRGPN